MLTALGVLAFVFALVISIALHEAGHLAAAKRFGMKASEYFIGFGPKLWSFRRGETEYGVKALLAGGYVKIVGMTSLEEVAAADEPRAFYRQRAGRRTLVLCAGSAVHLLLAVLLAFGALWLAGDQAAARPGTGVASVLPCVPATATAGCPAGAPPSPAERAGLRAGDQLVAVNGRPVHGYAGFVAVIRSHGGRPVRLTVERAGRERTVTATPGFITERLGGRLRRVGFLGISPTEVVPHYGPLSLITHTGTTLWSFLVGTANVVHHLPSELTAIVRGRPRTGNGPAGVVDLGRLSGQIAAASGVSVADRIAAFLLLIAELNFFVGLFNMLPLLPLDGGHVAIIAFEQARSRVFRLLHRPDPGRVDLMKVLPVAYTVIALFAGLTLLLVYAGIANPIRLQ